MHFTLNSDPFFLIHFEVYNNVIDEIGSNSPLSQVKASGLCIILFYVFSFSLDRCLNSTPCAKTQKYYYTLSLCVRTL